jgi:hypothetical protein
MLPWRCPDAAKQGRAVLAGPRESESALSVVGVACLRTPDPMTTRCSPANCLGWVIRSDTVVKSQAIDVAEVMTLPQSGRLDGGEQPQGLPDARAQRLFEVTFCIPALGIELFLVAARTAQVLFCTSHRGECITSRPEGFAVAMALATPNCRATAVADVPWREPTTSATAFVPGLPACTTLNLKAKP